MKEDGLITIFDPGSDTGTIFLPTRRCVHCGGHFPVKPAKQIVKHVYDREAAREMEQDGKTVRGFCPMCNGPTCGPSCSGKCVPLEQLLENYEKGLPLDHKPIIVGFSKGIGE